MKAERFVLTTVILVSLVLAVTPLAGAADNRFIVLHNFTGGNDGGGPVPFAALAMDAKGNLYGAGGGGSIRNCEGWGCGVIFEMVRGTKGIWKEKVLFDSGDPWTNGIFDSPLAQDSHGNLYGCTSRYGTHAPMFELTPGTPQWTFNPIWPSGCGGYVGLILDSADNLYGEFGSDFNGDIAELSPSSNGWVYTKLYEFCPSGSNCRDGIRPLAPFSWDAKGNLYGTTYNGGDPPCYSCGVAFQMTPNGDGTWTYHVLHRFENHNDGSNPGTGLTVDASGSAYGTAIFGGPHGNGDVYKLTPMNNGRWKLTVLYGFPNPNNGWAPVANLVFDKTGNMYGIASGPSGCGYICGVVFRLSPQTNGTWKYSVVHRFTGSDGNFPNGLTMGSQGNLFGTTQAGGKYGYGVVFEITP